MSSAAVGSSRPGWRYRNPDAAVLAELRRTRQRRRLGDTEWFDVAYRVYLFALGGVIAVVVVSDWTAGLIGDDVTAVDLVDRGPAVLGLVVAVAFALGVRSGADGGPVSIEAADVRHVLLAPISRRTAMLRPIGQRMRAAMFGVALPSAVIGQLVAREVIGSRVAWAGAGALFGALTGLVFVACAVLAHAVRLPRSMATLLATVVVSWQGAAAWAGWRADRDEVATVWQIGPANLAGSLAFWGVRQRWIDVVAIVVVLAAAGAALALGGRLRLEQLVRRGELVSQLRFAATVQDLRTVVMLRRQLRSETLRTRPWVARPVQRHAPQPRPVTPARRSTSSPRDRARASAALVWRRGVRSLLRLPSSRLVRIGALAVGAGVAASLSVRSTPLFLVGLLAAVFLLGMEAIEPLSQEIDRPDLTDALPVDRGWLYAHHLVAPAGLLSIAALVGAGAATAVEPSYAAAAFALAIPVTLAGAIGPAVGAVLDAPALTGAAQITITGAPKRQPGDEVSLVPPEFAGFTNAVSTLLPIALSAVSLLPVVAMDASSSVGTALRSTVGVALVLGVVTWWIRRRDRWGMRLRSFFAEGRDQRTRTAGP